MKSFLVHLNGTLVKECKTSSNMTESSLQRLLVEKGYSHRIQITEKGTPVSLHEEEQDPTIIFLDEFDYLMGLIASLIDAEELATGLPRDLQMAIIQIRESVPRLERMKSLLLARVDNKERLAQASDLNDEENNE